MANRCRVSSEDALELKHASLALINDKMTVIVVALSNDILEKLKSNIEEVRARGSVIYLFADNDEHFVNEPGLDVVNRAHTSP